MTTTLMITLVCMLWLTWHHLRLACGKQMEQRQMPCSHVAPVAACASFLAA
jgi:hypothetical protein